MFPEEVKTRSKAPEKLDQFLNCCEQARAEDGIAVQDRVPMRALSPLLPEMSVTSVDDEDTIVFRVLGQNMIDRYGFNPTGQNVLQFVSPEMRDVTRAIHQEIIGQPCGFYMEMCSEHRSGAVRRSQNIFYPMRRTADGPVQVCFGCCLHTELERTDPGAEDLVIMADWTLAKFVDVGFGTPDWAVHNSQNNPYIPA